MYDRQGRIAVHRRLHGMEVTTANAVVKANPGDSVDLVTVAMPTIGLIAPDVNCEFENSRYTVLIKSSDRVERINGRAGP